MVTVIMVLIGYVVMLLVIHRVLEWKQERERVRRVRAQIQKMHAQTQINHPRCRCWIVGLDHREPEIYERVREVLKEIEMP